MDNALPYDDVLALRDRMWELAPSLVRYDTLEHTSTDIALVGLNTLAARTVSATVGGAPFLKPISNFYQTDPISRAYVSPFFSYRFQVSLWTLLDLQVGDDGTVYTGICQGRAIRVLRIREVVSGCVCMTRQGWCRVVYLSSIDGISSIIKSFFNTPCHPLPLMSVTAK